MRVVLLDTNSVAVMGFSSRIHWTYCFLTVLYIISRYPLSILQTYRKRLFFWCKMFTWSQITFCLTLVLSFKPPISPRCQYINEQSYQLNSDYRSCFCFHSKRSWSVAADVEATDKRKLKKSAFLLYLHRTHTSTIGSQTRFFGSIRRLLARRGFE